MSTARMARRRISDFRVLILRVLILGEVAEVKDSLKGEALEAAFGEFGGLALQLGKLVAEFGVLEPTVQSAAAHFAEAGGLGNGGGGENGESRLPALGEAGVFYFSAVVSHCEPWPQWPFDRFGRVLIAAYQQRREWSPEGSRARCREFRTGGLLVFVTTPVFPCTLGLSNGSPTSRTYGFPLSRERRGSGGMDSRSPIGAGDKLRGKDG